MTRVLESPGFEITSAEAIDEAGRNLMRVDCEFGPLTPKEQVSLDLDPDASWIVRSCRYRSGGIDPGRLSTFEIEYGPSRNGIPLPRNVGLVDFLGVVHHCEFTEWSFAPTPRF